MAPEAQTEPLPTPGDPVLTHTPFLTLQGPGQTLLCDILAKREAILPCPSTPALRLLAQIFALACKPGRELVTHASCTSVWETTRARKLDWRRESLRLHLVLLSRDTLPVAAALKMAPEVKY